MANAPILYLPENTKKPKIFWCFKGDKMETLAGYGLKFTYGNLHHINTNFHLYTFFIV